MDANKLDKYSSAFTLADMEVFVFPELMYSLVLANLMSPIIWRWRQEDTFQRLEGKGPYKRLMRLKQYIMDEYEFNLDLQTWGLTSKQREIKRFEPWISAEQLAQSNGLFGYEGDKYYFDVDIRRHFGLDKFEGDIIPYWKTETVEAMTAFRRKPGYSTGAGECVSLSTLYAAAAFIVCDIPLEDIHMVLTPLHSQNFIDIEDGVITNNRRLVTKSMWFNGTEISNKAQRALRNEQVTVVANNTGFVHCLYDTATIEPGVYRKAAARLGEYLTTDLDALTFASFLRGNLPYHKHFQFCRQLRGEAMFVKAEVLFGYEHGSRFRIADMTFDKLLDEVSRDDYSIYPIEARVCCEQLMGFVRSNQITIHNPADREKMATFLAAFIPDARKFVEELYAFLHLVPRMPGFDKTYVPSEPIRIPVGSSREQVIAYLESIRGRHPVADLAFYAYRDMSRCQWEPFMKAAIERSPVSIEACKDKSDAEAAEWLAAMANESIYDGQRLAQPDEVANYGTGDGVEKAITLANLLHARNPGRPITIEIEGQSVRLIADTEYLFSSTKDFRTTLHVGS
jgi:hypothetical protein